MKRIAIITAFFLAIAFSANLSAEELKVGFSFAKPPYVCAAKPFTPKDYDTDAEGLGIEVELFKAAMEGTKYTFRPVYSPFKRVIADLASGRLDAAETAGPKEPGIHYSEPIIGCENYAITKKSDGITINSIEDLKGHSVVAWQGAMTDLGEKFTEVTRNHPKYRENPDQRAQYMMFRTGRVDVIVIDKYIFQWWDKELSGQYGGDPEYVYHHIFPGVNEYRMGFQDKEIKETFDQGLSKIREDGTYDRIFIRYLGDVKK